MSDFNFLNVDAEEIENNIISAFEEYTGYTLAISDGRRQFLQGLAYIVVMIANAINTTGRNNLLEYATGDALDELGKLVGVERFDSEYSTTTLEFNLSDAQPTSVKIPKGTRVTPDGVIFFATDDAIIIPSGELEGTMTATATVSGVSGNGFVAGQINKIVDGVPYVGAVTNTTTSTDGRDIEEDNSYRERIRLAPFSYSTAGAENAYRYLAMSANPNVGDVQVYRASAGNVTIAVVKIDGSLPVEGDNIINDIVNACSAKTARPLTDEVVAKSATAINSTINVSYYIDADDTARATEIQEAVAKAVEEYKLWQTTKIGRDINPDRLRKLMLNAGAEQITVNAPIVTEISDGEVAQFTATTVTYSGISE